MFQIVSRKSRHADRYRSRLRLEKLEVRRVLATYFVDTVSDSTGGFCAADSAAGNDGCSIRAALATAELTPEADRIEIPPGTYVLEEGSLDLFEPNNIDFVGTGSFPSDVIIDANGSRGFDLLATDAISNISLRGMTIQNGVADDSSGGGAINASSEINLAINSVVFENNSAPGFSDSGGVFPGSGGAIQTSGSLTINDSVFTQNSATGSGGAIDFGPIDATKTFSAATSEFRVNSAQDSGGAINSSAPDVAGVDYTAIFLDRVVFSSNTASRSGGGLSLDRAAVNLMDSAFDQNLAIGGPLSSGGAVAVDGLLSIGGNTTFTLNRSNANGGAIHFGAAASGDALTINGATFTSNAAGIDGGAVYADGRSQSIGLISLDALTLSENTSGDSGGAVFLTDAVGLRLTGSNFERNVAGGRGDFDGVGGGLYVQGVPDSTLNDTRFTQNSAVGTGGGAIFVDSSGTLGRTNFRDNSVTGNGTTFRTGGGGLSVLGETTIPSISLIDSTVQGNLAPAAGGIAIVDSLVRIQTSSILGNRATSTASGAGGIGVLQSTPLAGTTPALALFDTTVDSNTAAGEGGGIGSVDASVSVQNSVVSTNAANGGRGGGIGVIGVDNAPVLDLDASTISANTASGDGGGLVAVNAGLSLVNATVSGNQSTGANGGGLAYDNQDASVVRSISYSTFADNTAAVSGGTVSATGAPISVSGSIFSGADSAIAAGTFSSAGSNLDSGTSTGLNTATDLQNTNPQLAPLADNGGAVPTHALPLGSPAIDAGGDTAPLRDARGISRPQDGDGDAVALPDIGAFEAEPFHRLDFGDAPDSSYATLLSSDGARHVVTAELFLGLGVDAEAEGQPSVDAASDDFDGAVNDEDGVVFLTTLAAGTTAMLEVTASTDGGLLNAWIDFNTDGDWDDPGEQIFVDEQLDVGPNVLSLAVPAEALASCEPSYARFRFSTQAGLTPMGEAPDGEVEDYVVRISSGLITQSLSSARTAEDLVSALVGTGISTSNTRYTGSNTAVGTFSGGGSSIGIGEGIVLSSGKIADASGPNCSGDVRTDHGTAGDPDLNELSGGVSQDAAVLEFDFVPDSNVVQFQYVFSSEEYNEFVGSKFNDVFGFFVNGVNFATVGASQTVSINTINNGKPADAVPPSNPELFRNNDLDDGGGSIDTAMNGLTVVLTFVAPVRERQLNRIKLAIADIGDGDLDSNVFIKAGSFSASELDFGDLPAGLYPTLISSDGARHVIRPGFHLGSAVDGDADGQPSPMATGDDNDGTDDDDGVLLPGFFTAGEAATINVTASTAGFLDAWIDFNQDGTFQPAERIAGATALTAGSNAVTFAVPANATEGTTFARFRFSSTGGHAPTGIAADGEVEDYAVTIGSPETHTIRGHIFCDANGNELEDEGEAVAGAQVYLDDNGNRQPDSNERTTQTNASGDYQFDGLFDRTVTVAVTVPPSCNTIPQQVAVSRTSLDVGNLARSIAAADVDGDEDVDLLVVSELSESLTILENVGGSFIKRDTIQLADRPLSVSVWQPDAPGAEPVIAVAGIGTAATGGSIYEIRGQSVRQLLTGNGPIDVVVEDFDADGEADILSASFRSSDLTLTLGSTGASRVLAEARNVRAALSGDFNGDGRIDVAVAGSGYRDDAGSELKLLLGRGDGTFETDIVVNPDRDVVDIQARDLDGDGRDELLALASSGKLLAYRLTAGGLEIIGETAIAEGATSFATGDFNRDGKIDVAIAYLGKQSIELLTGNTAGGFASISTITNVTAPSDLVVADFDGDGVDEIAVANFYGQLPEFPSSQTPPFQLPSTATILKLNVAEQAIVVSGESVSTVNFSFPSANPDLRLDVNRDSNVTAGDALSVLAAMRAADAASGEEFSAKATQRVETDVNGDGRTSALDALMIINYLNQQQSLTLAPIAGEQFDARGWELSRQLDSDDRDDRVAAIDALFAGKLF